LIIAILAAVACAGAALFHRSRARRLARDLAAQHEAVLVLADVLTESIIDDCPAQPSASAREIIDAAVRRIPKD